MIPAACDVRFGSLMARSRRSIAWSALLVTLTVATLAPAPSALADHDSSLQCWPRVMYLLPTGNTLLVVGHNVQCDEPFRALVELVRPRPGGYEYHSIQRYTAEGRCVEYRDCRSAGRMVYPRVCGVVRVRLTILTPHGQAAIGPHYGDPRTFC